MHKWELLLPSTPFSSLEKKKKFPISFTTLSSQLTESSPSPCGAAGGADPVLAAQPENNAGGVCLMSSLFSPSRSSLEEGWEAEGARSGTGLSRCKSRWGDGTGARGHQEDLAGRAVLTAGGLLLTAPPTSLCEMTCTSHCPSPGSQGAASPFTSQAVT